MCSRSPARRRNPQLLERRRSATKGGHPAPSSHTGRWFSTANRPTTPSTDNGSPTRADCVVLHRLAVADGEKGRGVAAEFMRRTEALARERGVSSFRVDTNFDNRYMLRMLERLGFAYCGKIVYGSGERLAFEKPFEA